jgi:transcriptional regulator with XRE-family HTH domain
MSKQWLARNAGTSRQQLWRVMTGKSELTRSLQQRLATALGLDAAALVAGLGSSSETQNDARDAAFALSPAVSTSPPLTMTEYLTDARHLATTLRTLPSGDGGRRIKRALLNALEDLAVEAGRALPLDYSEIHRRVLSGEL